MVRVLTLTSGVVTAMAQIVAHSSFGMESQISLCNPCFQIGGQGINALLNYILNVGVIGGCGSLCAAAIPAGGIAAIGCELVCAEVGVKEFVKAIENADLDPIYFCEVVHACPAAPDDAYLEYIQAAALPASVPRGQDIQMAVDLNVTNDTGVGEFSISIDGPGTATPLGQSFFIKDGIPAGEQRLAVTLTLQDGKDDQGMPKTFEEGVYNFTFHVCQGECGSKHPHSKDFGVVAGSFNVTAAAPSPPAPPPATCWDQMDQKSCEATTDMMGEQCSWCDDFFSCQDSFQPCGKSAVQV